MGDDRPLSFPVFRSLWAATLLSNTGILIQSVGAAWLVVQAGARPQQIALVQTAASLPLVLISPIAGALSDRLDRRHVMIGAQALLVAVSVLLAGLAWSRLATPWTVIACTFLAGCSLALNGPAWMASLGDILPRQAIPGAVVYNAIGLNAARSVGPALGGVIVAGAGATANFIVNAGTSVLLAAALLRWRPVERASAPTQGHLAQSIWEGVRFARSTHPIRSALCRAVLFGTVGAPVQALLPLVAHDLLGDGSFVFGLLFGSFGLGALGGALLSAPVRRNASPESSVQGCTLFAAFAIAGAATSRSLWLTAPCLAVAGAAWVIAFATFNVAIQLASPRWVVARTLSLYQMSVFSGVALGSWLGGVAADHLGVGGSLLAAAAAALASMALARIAPLAPASGLPAESPLAEDLPHG